MTISLWKSSTVAALFAALAIAICTPECNGEDGKKNETKTDKKTEQKTDQPAEEPCITDKDKDSDGPCITDGSKEPITEPATGTKPERRLWADSYLWAKAPDFVVEKWLSKKKPDMKGKYVLIEYWATWCPPCRRSIPLLNEFHKKFGDELVVIGISEQSEEDVLKMEEPKIEFYSAIDTKERMKKKLGVFGIPHVIILEPGGYVIWEGFPLQPHYELNEKIIENILEVGRKLRAKEETDKKATAEKADKKDA